MALCHGICFKSGIKPANFYIYISFIYSSEWDSRAINNVKDSYGQEWVRFRLIFSLYAISIVDALSYTKFRLTPIEKFSNTHAIRLTLSQSVSSHKT